MTDLTITVLIAEFEKATVDVEKRYSDERRWRFDRARKALRDALEAAVQAPAVDREALENALGVALANAYDDDSVVLVEEFVAAQLIASGVLQDAREGQANALQKAASDLRGHYPESMFPRPDDEQYAKLQIALTEVGLTLDRFSADLMRRAADVVAARARQVREGTK